MKGIAIVFVSWLVVLATGFAQTKKTGSTNKHNEVRNGYDCLYQAGLANAFISGLYRGIITTGDAKKHGDFGLGAPHMLDGELVMNNGKMYQTTFTGQTNQVADSSTSSLVLVNFFKADTVLTSSVIRNKEKALQWLDSFVTNNNGLYAIRISGTFDYVKTRAFPPVENEPFAPLASMMNKQHVFEFQKIKGVLVGYKLPSYIDGLSIGGYHFHFLSDKQDAGGHIIDFTWQGATIEIDELHNFSVQFPQSADFKKINLKENRQDDLRKVETGNN
jgi:acetolactate decarboxylase